MAMVEMVIVLPLLLTVLFSIIEMGIMFERWLVISNAAREGAREAVLFRTNCQAGAVQATATSRVQAYANAAHITLPGGDISVTGACGGPNSSTTVAINYQHDFRVLGGLVPGLGTNINLNARSIMRNE